MFDVLFIVIACSYISPDGPEPDDEAVTIATAKEALSPPESDIVIMYWVEEEEAVEGFVVVIPDIVTVLPADTAVVPFVTVMTLPETANVAPDIEDVAEVIETLVNPDGKVIVTVPDAGIPDTASNKKLLVEDADIVWFDIVSDKGVIKAACIFENIGYTYRNNNPNILNVAINCLNLFIFIFLISFYFLLQKE